MGQELLFDTTNPIIIGVQGVDIIRERLNWLHDTKMLSWRKIAALDEYKGIPAGSLCAYAKNRPIVNNEHREIFGLPKIEYIRQVRNSGTGRFT